MTIHRARNRVTHLLSFAAAATLLAGAPACGGSPSDDGAASGSSALSATKKKPPKPTPPPTPVASGTLSPLWQAMVGGVAGVVSFSPDGSLVATGGLDSATTILRGDDGAIVQRLAGHYSGDAQALAFSPDNSLLAVGSSGGPDLNLSVFKVSDGSLPFGVLEGHHNGTSGVAYTPNGQYLISAGGLGEGTTKIWQASTMTAVTTLDDGRINVDSVALSPDGKTIATGLDDGLVDVWDIATGTRTTTLSSPVPAYPNDTLFESSIAYSPDGILLAAPSTFGVTLWSTATHTVVRQLSAAPAGVVSDTPSSLAFSPDGKTLASAMGYWEYPGPSAPPTDASIRFWRVSDGTLLTQYDLGTSSGVCVAFSPSGAEFAYGLYEGTVAVAATPAAD